MLIAAATAGPAFNQRCDSPYGDRERARDPPANRRRFDEARRELFDFAGRIDQDRYERHELDQAIERIDRVARNNSLDPRDRDALEDDLRR